MQAFAEELALAGGSTQGHAGSNGGASGKGGAGAGATGDQADVEQGMGEGAEAVQAGVAALEDDMLQKITKPLGAPGPPRMPAHARAACWERTSREQLVVGGVSCRSAPSSKTVGASY